MEKHGTALWILRIVLIVLVIAIGIYTLYRFGYIIGMQTVLVVSIICATIYMVVSIFNYE
jgi:hypothetical protein